MTNSSKDCFCPNQTSPVRVIVERTRDSVTDIFSKYRHRVSEGARQAVELARKRSQEFLARPAAKPKCEDKGIIKSKQKQGFFSRLNFDEVATVLLVLMILLLLFLGLFLVRSYNHAYAYGSGGCLWPMFWFQCQIMT